MENQTPISEQGQAPVEDPLKELNEQYPIDQMLTEENSKLALELSGMGWVSIYRNSPTNHGESEVLMGKMTVEAIANGGWKDIPLQGHHVQVVEAGFAQIVDGPEGKLLRPTRALVAFAKERLAPFAPKPPVVNA